MMTRTVGTESVEDSANLIVNADDYGYFPGITAGILDCVRLGRVTAVGVMANRPWFDRDVALLRDDVDVDVGVHLVLTVGAPLTPALATALPQGQFPGKTSLAMSILRRRLDLRLVRDEWRAQIERCLTAGLRVRFLNSHEHMHMLPPLFRVLTDLAEAYGIRHIRLSVPEWPPHWSPGSLVRDAGLALLARLNRGALALPALPLLGMAASGRLDLAHLRRIVAGLRPGSSAELMCHPGRCAPDDDVEPATRAYHNWEGERRVLCDPSFGELLERYRVRLVRYRDLSSDAQPAVTRVPVAAR
jgi:predicted glycoside hydrolase/deacetylase ChbG (UPF0249 family)